MEMPLVRYPKSRPLFPGRRRMPGNAVSIKKQIIIIGDRFHDKFINKYVDLLYDKENGILVLVPYDTPNSTLYKVSYNPSPRRKSPDTHPYISPTKFIRDHPEVRGVHPARWDEAEKCLIIKITPHKEVEKRIPKLSRFLD